MILHELYFGALGGNGLAAGDIRKVLGSAFASHEAWEAEFRRTAMALAGGSGWCVLAFKPPHEQPPQLLVMGSYAPARRKRAVADARYV